MGAREKLLGSAIDLLRRRGVAGTGVAEIIEHGDVARRSLYLNFPDGKSQLMAEATQLAGYYINQRIETFVALPTAQEALRSFVVEWRDVVAQGDFAAGCPIAAAGLSRCSAPEVADVAGVAFSTWQRTLGDALRGHGMAEAAALQLANMMLAAVEGAVTICIAQKSLAALDDVESELMMLLDCRLNDGDKNRERALP